MADEVEYTTGERRKMAVEWERFFGTDWPEHLNRQEAQDQETQEQISRLAATTEQLSAGMENFHLRLDESVIYQGETRAIAEETREIAEETRRTVKEMHGWAKPKMESEQAREVLLRDGRKLAHKVGPIIRALTWIATGAFGLWMWFKTGHWPK